MSDVNYTLPPGFPVKIFGLDENHNIFPGKLFKGNFVTFLVLYKNLVLSTELINVNWPPYRDSKS